MDSNNTGESYLKQLSDKYWKGNSTISEEDQLKQAISSQASNMDPLEVDYFNTIDQFSKKELDGNFDELIMSEIQQHDKPQRFFQQDWFKLAASLVLAGTLGLGLWHNAKNPTELALEDDPRKAFEVAKQALMMVSVRMNKGKDAAASGLAKFEETRIKISESAIGNTDEAVIDG